jgi:hypothetical protein
VCLAKFEKWLDQLCASRFYLIRTFFAPFRD